MPYQNDLTFSPTAMLAGTFCLFLTGFIGVLLSSRRNMLMTLMCLEVVLLSIVSLFVLSSAFLTDIFGQIAALVLLALAGAESALGLTLVVVMYKIRGSLKLTSVMSLRL